MFIRRTKGGSKEKPVTLVKRIVSVHKIFSRKFASIHIKQI
jgi:hypothetical protein